MHAFGWRCEASHNKLMRPCSWIFVGWVADVALGAGEAEVPIDAVVAVFRRVVRPGGADWWLIVVDWLLVKLLWHWRRARVHQRPGDGRVGWCRCWMLFRVIRIRIILKFHRNSHLGSRSYRNVVVDVVCCRRAARLLQEVLQVRHLRWWPLQDFVDVSLRQFLVKFPFKKSGFSSKTIQATKFRC